MAATAAHGGSITFRAREGINTLVDFRVERTFRAENGEPGGGRDMTGRGGNDTLVMVPVGTIVRDADTGEVLGDMAAGRHGAAGGARRQGRLGQPAFQIQQESLAATLRSRVCRASSVRSSSSSR